MNITCHPQTNFDASSRYRFKGLVVACTLSLFSTNLSAGKNAVQDSFPSEKNNELKRSVVLRPNKVHENCFRLSKQQSIHFSFTTVQALAFNLHYHQDGHVQYPIEPQSQTSFTQTFIASADKTYCLMWRNKNTTKQTLQYQINLIES